MIGITKAELLLLDDMKLCNNEVSNISVLECEYWNKYDELSINRSIKIELVNGLFCYAFSGNTFKDYFSDGVHIVKNSSYNLSIEDTDVAYLDRHEDISSILSLKDNWIKNIIDDIMLESYVSVKLHVRDSSIEDISDAIDKLEALIDNRTGE